MPLIISESMDNNISKGNNQYGGNPPETPRNYREHEFTVRSDNMTSFNGTGIKRVPSSEFTTQFYLDNERIQDFPNFSTYSILGMTASEIEAKMTENTPIEVRREVERMVLMHKLHEAVGHYGLMRAYRREDWAKPEDFGRFCELDSIESSEDEDSQ